MKRFMVGLAATLLASSVSAGDAPIRKVVNPVKDQYIVRLNGSLPLEQVRSLAQALSHQHGGKLHRVWSDGGAGFAVELPEASARGISRHPAVLFVEENAEWTISQAQSQAPWHLDRLDQRTLPLDTYYRQDGRTAEVFVYVLDTGVRASHHEFRTSATDPTSRVLPGVNVRGDGQAANNPCPGVTVFSSPEPPCGQGDKYCFKGGHGTAVASILGGRTYGVAKDVRIIPVRTHSCAGISDSLTIGAGLEWIYNDKANRGGAAVLVISSGMDLRDATAAAEQDQRTYVEEWIDRLIDERDITVVVAANNQEIEASFTSPARMARGNGGKVITVGGSTNDDRRWHCNPSNVWEDCNSVTVGSNYGQAVDIFAPAQNIPSAGIKEEVPPDDPLYPFSDCCRDSDTAERQGVRSGTSFAAPIVAGVAARILAASPALTPDQVWSRIRSGATDGIPATEPPGMTESAGDPNSGPLHTPHRRLVFRSGVPRSSCGGDFDGDGQADVVWRNSATGANAVWYMNRTAVVGSALLPAVADTNWRIEAVAGFDAGTSCDIFWRNYATGANAIWLMNGTAVVNTVSLPAVVDPNWSVAGAADFSGDGKTDLVWRNQATGDDAVWVLGAPGVLSTTVTLPGLTDFNWRLSSVGDFNGDGDPDLLWQNTATGAVAIWVMQGATYLTSAVVQGTAPASWYVGGRADYDADGYLDLLWRNGSTGDDAYWYLGLPAGAVLGSDGIAGLTDLNWQIAGPH